MTDKSPKITFITDIKQFPPIVNDKINTEQFLESIIHLVEIIDTISTIFAPVKYDMLGNIKKLESAFMKDKEKNSCLLTLVTYEKEHNIVLATEGLLWLNRALHFVEILFQQIVKLLQNDAIEHASMKKMLANAYEGSVKKYHNWISQQLFSFISRLCPSLDSMLKTFGADKNMALFTQSFYEYTKSMSIIRLRIDKFYLDNNIN